MITALFAFLIAHAPTFALNKWACDTVNSQAGDGEGCYDWCYGRAPRDRGLEGNIEVYHIWFTALDVSP